jgi:hypothetical protein
VQSRRVKQSICEVAISEIFHQIASARVEGPDSSEDEACYLANTQHESQESFYFDSQEYINRKPVRCLPEQWQTWYKGLVKEIKKAASVQGSLSFAKKALFENDKKRWPGETVDRLQLGYTNEPIHSSEPQWSSATGKNFKLYHALHACATRLFSVTKNYPELVHMDRGVCVLARK